MLNDAAADQATFTTATLSVGTHTITAPYNHDVNFLGSTSAALTLTVNQDATNTTPSSSSPTSAASQDVTLSAVVTANDPAPARRPAP